jgi:D-glycero-D-manno-heptose 1,7-bisphosphate phosphatase
MVYYPEHGIVDSPFTAPQLRLVEGIAEPLNEFRKLGYKLILVSNQPGIAKGHFTLKEFENMKKKMTTELAKIGVTLDGEYYCFHHPHARSKKYRVSCNCRKPRPGMLVTAAKERDIDLNASFMIGDGIVDILAGKRAGCKTILLGNQNGFLSRLVEESQADPDFQVGLLRDAAAIIAKLNGIPRQKSL